MTEQHFISSLERALRSLPVPQRDDIINRYRTHFAEARLQGRSEEEIAHALGDPRTLARSFRATYYMQQIEQPPEGQKVHTVLFHMLRVVLLICTILIFNFVIMLWPVVLVAALLTLTWIAVLIFVAGTFLFALGLIMGAFKALVLGSIYVKLTLIFYSLAAASGGILLLGVLYFLTRGFLLNMLRYVHANIQMVKPRAVGEQA